MSTRMPAGGAGGAVVVGLRRLARSRPAAEAQAAESTPRCDLCRGKMAEEHRHLLSLEDRRILCACEPCWAMRAGDPGLRPTGSRSLLLDRFELGDELWAKFQIPIGLAFFFLSEASGGVVALYPSPAGATESELYLEAWNELVSANPVLEGLEPEAEALVVNRMGDPHGYAIVPIDRCYELVGTIKTNWTGISGGSSVDDAVRAFFVSLGAAGGTG